MTTPDPREHNKHFDRYIRYSPFQAVARLKIFFFFEVGGGGGCTTPESEPSGPYPLIKPHFQPTLWQDCGRFEWVRRTPAPLAAGLVPSPTYISTPMQIIPYTLFQTSTQ